MIDPNNIIKFDRTDAELQELILFLVLVAGKKASTVSRQLDAYLKDEQSAYTNIFTPFELIKFQIAWGGLEKKLKEARFGQYTRLTKAFTELVTSKLNLRKCSKDDLMKIHGIGRKSASCFLAWTRKGFKVAMLDTHLLKWISKRKEILESFENKGVITIPEMHLLDIVRNVTIPKSTPSSEKLYNTLELFYLANCKHFKKDPTEYDLEIWRVYSAPKGSNAQWATV